MPNRELIHLGTAITRLGIPLPARLANLHAIAEELDEGIRCLSPDGDPLGGKLSEGHIATMAPADVLKLVLAAAEHRARIGKLPEISQQIVDKIFADYERSIRHGGTADEIIESIRPAFDQAVAGITEANQHLSPDDTRPADEPPDAADAVRAWQSIGQHRRRLDAIYSTVLVPLVRDFGAGGDHDYSPKVTSIAAAFVFDGEHRNNPEAVQSKLRSGIPHPNPAAAGTSSSVTAGSSSSTNQPKPQRSAAPTTSPYSPQDSRT
jgi:hypothetical protein